MLRNGFGSGCGTLREVRTGTEPALRKPGLSGILSMRGTIPGRRCKVVGMRGSGEPDPCMPRLANGYVPAVIASGDVALKSACDMSAPHSN
jgi:hypothetical protein